MNKQIEVVVRVSTQQVLLNGKQFEIYFRKMASNHSVSAGLLWLDTHRHSSRILNKNVVKLDISTVNNKIDFMRSLNLFCTKNTRESQSKLDWEVLLPKNSLPLKKCSVVVNSIKCDECGQSLKNQKDVEFHKSLHSSSIKDQENIKENFLSNCEKQILEENYMECNNNVQNLDKIKSDKKTTHRRKSKDAFTKVTLRIGGEVISKVYCKKKYLNKVCQKDRKASGMSNHDDCKSCNEIKDILHTVKMSKSESEVSLTYVEDRTSEQSDRNIARIRKMAAALVELELQQKAIRIQESELFNSEEKSNDSMNDDAVVPVVSNDINLEDTAKDDEIQEVLHITKNMNSSNTIKQKSSTDFKSSKFTSIKNCEIITIDDEICDDFEDDCIIVDERLPNKNSLSTEENSYIFHVSNKDVCSTNFMEAENIPSLTQKRKSFSDEINADLNTLKKQRTNNSLQSQFPYLLNFNIREKEKENNIYEGPSIKLSQFALPLRLINF